MESSEVTDFIYGCKINHALLENVWQLATRDMPEGMRTTASTTVAITKTSADTLEGLIEQLEGPSELGNLSLDIDSGSQAADARHIYISIDRGSAYISVSGSNATWVRGRFSELRDLFRASRSPLGMHEIPTLFTPMAVGGVTAIALEMSLLFAGQGVSRVAIFEILPIAGAVILWIVLRRQSLTTISLTEVKKNPWSRGDWIALAIAILTLATLAIVAIQTWGK